MKIIRDKEEQLRNYYALVVAILARKSCQQALKEMGIKTSRKASQNTSNLENLNESVLEEVIRQKSEGKSWGELGKKYEVNPKTLHQKVKRYMGTDWENREW